MIRPRFLPFAWAVLGVLLAGPLPAQVVPDGATNTLNNVTNTVTGAVTVGTNGSFTLLILTNGALLSNTLDGVIGFNTSAKSNTVRLHGAGTRWLVGGTLLVGSNGSSSRLIVSNGALVGANRGYIGYTSVSSNNEVVVTGTNSMWTNTLDMLVGLDGSWNRLVISNGALAGDRHGELGLNALSRSNEAIVTGAGSYWSNRGSMSVGVAGSGNRLIVNNGGLVGNLDGYFGEFTTGSGTNTAIVTDAGSLWSNRGDLYLGLGSTGNQLIVSNGGGVIVSNSAYLGYGSTGGTNSALITDAGSYWRIGNELYVGLSNRANRIVISNGAGVLVGNTAYVGMNTGSASNEVVVVGTNSLWTNSALYLGYAGAGNRLVISNGGRATANSTYLGLLSTSSNNIVVVTGVGSVWSNATELTIGNNSAGNTLTIANGGRVDNENGYVGRNASTASNNVVFVTGTGSVWSNRTELTIGNNSAGNTLTIANGGRVDNVDGYVGRNASTASNNTVVVSGTGSLWDNATNLFIGDVGSGNRLVITNGGQVETFYSFVGRNASSSNNEVVVTGTNSLWTVGLDLDVGEAGAWNKLVVSNGGKVSSTFGRVGATADNNLAVVIGAGSVWSNASLGVGVGGHGNSLIISNGGTVIARSGTTISANANAQNNSLIVASGNLIGTNAGGTAALTVGKDGQGTLTFNGGTIIADRLIVTNNGPAYTNSKFNFNYGDLTTLNGSVITQTASFFIGTTAGQTATWTMLGGTNTIGLASGADTILGHVAGSRAVVTVSGPSAVWSNSAVTDLVIGEFGGSNRLVVSSGAMTFNRAAYLGFNSGSSNNEAWVTGSGSLWSNASDLYLGNAGSGNRLIVSNGASVVNANGRLGSSASSHSNEAVVLNPGSVWSNRFGLFVGNFGGANRLTVADGGQVTSLGGYLGYGASSSNNTALVTGGNSLWNNSGNLYVGNDGSGNQLIVSNGGQVFNDNGVLGYAAGSTNNVALVTGTNSLWTNASSLTIGNADGGNQLIVSNGGVVANGNGYLGVSSAASNNSATVTDAGSFWNNTNNLFVGYGGSGNRLVISNGGGVFASSNAYLGYTATGGSNTAWVTGSNSFWTIGDKLYIGNSNSGNLLVVSNGAAVQNFRGHVGFSYWAENNLAVVTGAGSRWSNTESLQIGEVGSSNRLLISAGGLVASAFGYIGLNGTSNVVVVTDSGSFWSNSNALHVGTYGSGNQLIVSNGGTVRSGLGSIGATGLSSNNLAVVTGAGSLWTNGGNLHVGEGGAANQLIVSDGGTVRATSSFVGEGGVADNNRVIVTGAGSLLRNISDVVVGFVGRSNQLSLSNGGTVVARSVVVGGSSSSQGSLLTIAGGNLIATNAPGTAALTVGRDGQGTLDFNGGTIVASQLFVTNNGPGYTNSVFNFNHGDLTTLNGSIIAQSNDFLIGTTSNQTASWLISGGTNLIALGSGRDTVLGGGLGARGAVTVTGAGTLWSNSDSLWVGSNSAFNQLVVSNGATVRNNQALIGYDSTASNNLAYVSGTNSVWTNKSFLNVGISGSGNQLLVSDGGTVQSGGSSIGYSSSASNNLATVTGVGSLWTNLGILTVGNIGSGNQLLVSNGGTVQNADGYVGFDTSASNNVATVTGVGSLWINTNRLTVGHFGSGNQLLVSNGGTVQNPTGYIGFDATASNNVATVTGAGSLWSNAANLLVGYSGSGNQLIISNGGGVWVGGHGYLGFITNGGGGANSALVTGTNSAWNIGSNLYVGYGNSGNQLTVSGNGSVTVASQLILGASAAASDSNRILVTGAGSRIESGTLAVGGSGRGNQLVVSNGATLISAFTFFAGASLGSNSIWITGPGSVWSNANRVDIGVVGGSGNQLIVSNGGRLINSSNFVRMLSSNNLVVVDGPGSFLSSQNEVEVGTGGSRNQLLIRNGGWVADSEGGVGVGSFASSNLALVTGAGSVWSNANALYVGTSGDGNLLNVSSNGWVTAPTMVISDQSAASNNSITVTGGHLRATNIAGTGSLVVGRDGQGTLTFNGGTIVADQLFVTNNGPGYTNSVFNFNYGTLATLNGSVISQSNSFVIGNTFNQTASWLITGGTNTLTVGAGTSTILAGAVGSSAAVTVTGGSTLWSNSGSLQVGGNGASSRLVVSNRAVVLDHDGMVSAALGSTNNSVLVTGAGSLWSNRGSLYIGSNGSGATLLITNGGAVFASNAAYLGFGSSAANGRIVTDGGTLRVANAAGNAVFDLRRGTNVLNAGTNDVDRLVMTNAGFPLSAGFIQNASIGIPPSGSPIPNYPSTNVVSGLSGSVTKVVVTLFGLTHVFPDDLDILLVGPAGQKVMLMSDAGGPTPVPNETLRFDDDAPTALPDSSPIGSAAYRPADYEPGETMAAPAPAGPYSTNLSAFNGTNPNGTWSLYVYDDNGAAGGGTIEDWSLQITTTASPIGGAGVFEFNGGTLITRGTTNANGQTFMVGNGTSAATLQLLGGTHLFSNNLAIRTNATLTGNGTILGTVTNFGTIAPGNSAGSLTVNGSLRLTNSSLMSFELGGLIATNDYDVVNVTNFVQFAGTLSLSLLNNFLPAPANTFTLVSFGSASGSFANISGGRVSLTNNLASFAVTQSATNLILGSVTYVDSDGDGQGDLQEQAAGTNPNDPASALAVISITKNGSGHNVILFQSVPAKNYRIEYSSDLVTWSVATTSVSAIAATTQWADDGTLTGGLPGTKRFYRIGLQ